MDRDFIPEREVAERFSMCRKTFIRRVVKPGKIDFILIGRSRYYDPADIEAYKEREKRKWQSEKRITRRSGTTISQLGVVDIEDLRAQRQKAKRN